MVAKLGQTNNNTKHKRGNHNWAAIYCVSKNKMEQEKPKRSGQKVVNIDLLYKSIVTFEYQIWVCWFFIINMSIFMLWNHNKKKFVNDSTDFFRKIWLLMCTRLPTGEFHTITCNVVMVIGMHLQYYHFTVDSLKYQDHERKCIKYEHHFTTYPTK